MRLWGECSLTYLSFQDVTAEIYDGLHFKSHWMGVLVFRVISFLYLVSMATLATSVNKNKARFLSSWIYFLTILHFALGIFISAKIIRSKRKSNNPKSVEHELSEVGVNNYNHRTAAQSNCRSSRSLLHNAAVIAYYVIANMTLNLCSLTVLIYWTVLGKFDSRQGSLTAFLSVDRHGINFGVVLIDFLLVHYPIHFMMFLYTDIVLLVYLLYHFVQFQLTSISAYALLNYDKNFGTAIAICIGGPLLVIPLSHFIWYWLYRVKLRVFRL